jgi:hypothetical protein
VEASAMTEKSAKEMRREQDRREDAEKWRRENGPKK